MQFTLGVVFTLLLVVLVSAQTYTSCNPLQKSCPADPAFGKTGQTFDFTSGASSAFTATGSVTFDSTNGAAFTIAKQGDGPLIQSNWYIMFGRVEYTIKSAPGTGIVSSAVLQSDDLDEIDWEWLGVDNDKAQTNYFGKGDTSTYSRGAFSDNAGNHEAFHTYSVDWTSEEIVWAIDGKTVRVLTPSTADTNQYPQTPMMIKVGVWAGGDPNNAKGTIQWAGGETDYSKGPFVMYMKSLSVTDYSTGSSYTYSDKSGTWQSIVSDGGKINGNSAVEPASTQSAPSVTATVDIPIPWSGTHKETSSWTTPDVWPWVSTDSPSASSTGFTTSGWESGSGHVQPPDGGSLSEHSSPEPTLPKEKTTKTESMLQSTSLFTSVASASWSDSFFPSGYNTAAWKKKVTHTWHRPTIPHTEKSGHEGTATAMNAPTSTPMLGGGVNLIMAPVLFGCLCVFLGGIFVLL
ncbi:hypothetical protein N7488_009622 [Penicillium malachiteum]|nr:hypothetical protein N7488_009622 [Penicillium malachiteum]